MANYMWKFSDVSVTAAVCDTAYCFA